MDSREFGIFDKAKMQHDLAWLAPGQCFPPLNERARFHNYDINKSLFHTDIPEEYAEYIKRISRVVGNFEDVISFAVVFAYPKLMTLKMADLVCGEYPNITSKDDKDTDMLNDIRDDVNFDAKMYSTVIDMSRYGDAIWRIYKENGKYTFTVWDPAQWIPIVSQDGTNTILQNVLCWIENRSTSLEPDYYLVAQIHDTGFYTEKTFKVSGDTWGITSLVSEKRINTGLERNAVIHLRSYEVTDTIFGDEDYMSIDAILSELAARVAQVSIILDKHADPILTGPASLLEKDSTTGKLVFKPGKYYATQAEDNPPSYLVWDGQLEAAFKEMEFLVDQLYILSEMGSALAGARDSTFQAVSGAAMRFKMVTPLDKARRISNALTRQTRRLVSILTSIGYEKKLEIKEITISWKDGIPDDPREEIENAKLACGENTLMPLKEAIMRFLKISSAEADEWITRIDERAQELAEREQANLDAANPEQKNAGPGPKKGQVASAKGSKKGITNANPVKQD